MDTMQTNFECHPYQPLHDATKEIRLLHLHGKQKNHPDDETIRCSLTHTSLKSVESFEALSYVWGEIANQRTILLDGRPFQVTDNLYIALTHLRRNDEDRRLWIDALCINQNDDHERSRQVAEMQHIYRVARSVIVFLGGIWSGCDAVMDMMLAGGQDEALHWDPLMEPHVVSHGMDVTSKTLQSHIITFFTFPWWFRVWTVQEYCLAQDTVFQCGDRTINGAFVQRWYRYFYAHRMTCCRGVHGFGEHLDVALPGETVIRSISRLLAIGFYRRCRGETSSVRVMTDFRVQHCLNPRDKVYGLLGLFRPELRSLILPDYTRPTKDVYSDLVFASVISTKSLDILSCKYGSTISGLNLPSFVPDWTAHVENQWQRVLYDRLRYITYPVYNACKSSAADLQKIGPCEVGTTGIRIDQIISVVHWEPWGTMLLTLQELVNTDEQILVYADRATAFWQTLCGGIIHDNRGESFKFRPAEKRDLQFFLTWETWIKSNKNLDIDDEEIWPFTRPLYAAVAQRQFVVTKKGYIGWAPCEAEVGDSVVLLSGGRVPYVLRPVDLDESVACKTSDGTTGDCSQRQAFTFIGDAYIHGIMQGECYDKEKLERFHLV